MEKLPFEKILDYKANDKYRTPKEPSRSVKEAQDLKMDCPECGGQVVGKTFGPRAGYGSCQKCNWRFIA